MKQPSYDVAIEISKDLIKDRATQSPSVQDFSDTEILVCWSVRVKKEDCMTTATGILK